MDRKVVYLLERHITKILACVCMDRLLTTNQEQLHSCWEAVLRLAPSFDLDWSNCEKMVIVKYSFSIQWIEKIWKYFLGWKGLINLMVEASVDFSVLTSHPAIFFQNLFLGICLIWFISAELQVSYDSFSE